MKKSGIRRPSASMIVSVCAVVFALTGTAFAAGMIGSSEIKNNSIKSQDIKDGNVRGVDIAKGTKKRLKGKRGATGATGQNGNDGATGATGPASAATYTNPQWGVIDRNTIGSPTADLRGGPFAGTDAPPFGQGSLSLITGSPTEKVSFGNEVDFIGDKIADLNEVGFYVFNTDENTGKGPNNMPSIAFEINPKGAGGTTTTFSTMVFNPNQTAPGWSDYIDATNAGTGFWGLTGSQFNSPATQANCGINGPRCSFAQIKTLLASGTGAEVKFSAAVTKGRDFEFQGAVDGLRINATIYDFEPFGVQETPAP